MIDFKNIQDWKVQRSTIQFTTENTTTIKVTFENMCELIVSLKDHIFTGYYSPIKDDIVLGIYNKINNQKELSRIWESLASIVGLGFTG